MSCHIIGERYSIRENMADWPSGIASMIIPFPNLCNYTRLFALISFLFEHLMLNLNVFCFVFNCFSFNLMSFAVILCVRSAMFEPGHNACEK